MTKHHKPVPGAAPQNGNGNGQGNAPAGSAGDFILSVQCSKCGQEILQLRASRLVIDNCINTLGALAGLEHETKHVGARLAINVTVNVQPANPIAIPPRGILLAGGPAHA